MWKVWANCGVYGHSRILSLAFRLFLIIAMLILSAFHFVMDHQPFFPKDPRNLSLQMRSFTSILSVVKWLIPIKQTWPLLNNCLFRWDYIYLRTFNRICNYGMGALIHIPIMTNISKRSLLATHFADTCCDDLSSKHKVSVNEVDLESDAKSMDSSYAEFVPRDVDYLWVSGSDEIEEQSFQHRFIFYLHGGGYSLGGPSHIGYVSRLSTCTNTRVLFVDFAKPPVADIPYQVDQILTIYLYMLLYHGVDPKRIMIHGDSAGGGLCMLMIQKLSSLGLTALHPAGIVMFSPWLDLTLEADSWIDCQYHDLIVCKSYVSRSGLIAVGNDKNNLRSPYFSALYAENYAMDCNVMLLVSKHECLYDDSARLVEQMRTYNHFHEINQEGADRIEEGMNGVELVVGGEIRKELLYLEYEYMPHAFGLFYQIFPEADVAMDKVCRVMRRWVGTHDDRDSDLASW